MWSALRALAVVGLLTRHVSATRKEIHDVTTVYDTTTVRNTHYVDVTVYNTHTDTVKTTVTECTTTTLHYTVSVTETRWATVTHTRTDSATVTNTRTDSATVTNTATTWTAVTNTNTDSTTITDTDLETVTSTGTASVTVTDTDSATITNTATDSVTVTDTDSETITTTNTDTDTATTTTTVPTTTSTTRTVFTTTYDPCPKSCSVSAERVNLYYWPTDRPYTYPTTHVDHSLSYTFTSPSVYMYVPHAVGVNTLGQTTGPSTRHWIIPLELHQVSTIAPAGIPHATPFPIGPNNITRQLTLADLGTDCPKTLPNPTALATMVAGDDPRCNPVLAAPRTVSSWAYPCNACGRFGLFDPPYAVPTLTGALVVEEPEETTTRTLVVPTVAPTVTATPGSLPGSGVVTTATATVASSVSASGSGSGTVPSSSGSSGGAGEETATESDPPTATAGTLGARSAVGDGLVVALACALLTVLVLV